MPELEAWYTIPLRRDGTIAQLRIPVVLTSGDIQVLRDWFDWYERIVLSNPATPAPADPKETTDV